MKLTHEFLIRTNCNLPWLKFCTNYNDYMAMMEELYDDETYDTIENFQEATFGLFVEFYINYFSKDYGIFNVLYKPTTSNIDFVGKDDKGNPATILSLFKHDDSEITVNGDNLSSFFVTSRIKEKVGINDKKNIFIISNGKVVNEFILTKFPVSKDKVVFVLLDEIIGKVDNNIEFWKQFALNTKKEKVSKKSIKRKVLRDFQIEAVDTMLNHSIGQVILPTGTGKSVIQAEYCRKYITDKNPTPVILIVSPRIVLTYQLLEMVSSHLISSNIDAHYINLSSGDMETASQSLYKQMVDQGLIRHEIKATTDTREIKKLIDNSIGKRPVIISATYHSAWRLSELTDIKIDVVLCDEAHNLVMGRFSEDFKSENLKLTANSKFFFTATPCETPSNDGKGMNNKEFFGNIIYTKSYRTMIERNEILPITVHRVDVNTCVLLKNKKGDVTPDNIKEVDFDRDITAKVTAIKDAFKYHSDKLVDTSCNSNLISPKLLITVDGLAVLKGILKSSIITDLQNEGIHIFAISTEIKYYNNGQYYDGSDFKEKFMMDIKSLKETDPAIIFHIDMVGEGLDVSGITSVMAFSTQGTQKLIQLIGRAMRLHDVDRKNLYDGKFFKGMDRIKMMIKPFAYFILPMFLDDSQDLHTLTTSLLKKIHEAYDYIPSVIYDQGRMIGDNEIMTNQEFKGKHDEYNELTFKHEIEMDNLRHLMNCYKPQISL